MKGRELKERIDQDSPQEEPPMDYGYGLVAGFISFFVIVFVVQRKRSDNNRDNDH